MTDEGALFYEHSRRAVSEIQNAAALLDQGKLTQQAVCASVPVLFGQVFATRSWLNLLSSTRTYSSKFHLMIGL
jgi:DNA-binding transcriptional LysR family regulator